MSVKHPQYILAVDSEFLSIPEGHDRSVCLMQLADFAAMTEGRLIIAQRNKLETDPRYRQVLPYAVLYQMTEQGCVIYPYRRGAAGGEARLHGNVSIGFGGHVDLADVKFSADSVIDVIGTVLAGCSRELKEELTLTDEQLSRSQVLELGTLLDNSNDVGKVHMAYVLMIQLPTGIVIESNEDAIEVMQPMTPRQLLDAGLPLESWSEAVLETVIVIEASKGERE